MPHRTSEIVWTPASPKAWATFSAARQEAARLWNDLIGWHAQARQQHATDPSFRFPTSSEWEKRCQRQYPHLHSQSVQQLISEFLEAVKGCLELRKAGDKEARFPWKQRRFRDVPFTNQGAKLRNGFLLLPNGKAGELAIKLPRGASLPAGRLMEAKLSFGLVRLVFSDEPPPPPRGSDEAKAARAVKSAAAKSPPPVPAVGVDLGVNTLLAATDGERAVVVSGRGVKAFPGAHVVVGKPFNDAARRLHRTQAQQVSQACTRQAIEMLGYKLASAREVVEAFSSQTCPGCGCRQKCRRTFQCKECGFRAPRDVLGALNILQIGQQGAMAPRASLTVPAIVWTRPSKYPGRKPGSSGGTPARSSAGASSPRSLDL